MQTLVVRHDDGDAVLHDDAADQPRRAPLEHFGDRTLLATAPIGADDVAEHAIAVQHFAHFGRRQINIVAARVRTQESETFRVSDDRCRESDRAATPRRNRARRFWMQLAIAQHRRQTLGQRLEIARLRQVQFLRDDFGRHAAARGRSGI